MKEKKEAIVSHPGRTNIEHAKEKGFRGNAPHPGDEDNAAGHKNSENKNQDKFGSKPVDDKSINRGDKH